jgi:hypothetical protein
MDRNWNRGNGAGGGAGGAGGEKMYKQSYSGGQNYQNYRKKNDYSGQEYYSKIAKPVVQPIKKEGLQVALIENELMDVNFSWIKNSGTCILP